MKRLMTTMLMATVLPVLGSGWIDWTIVCAEDYTPHDDSYPDVLPVYNSYYDSSTNQLCIYGAAVSTMINVRIICRGNEVLYDYVSPEQLPAWYDCSSYDSGTYLVVISAGDTVLSTFSFTKL